TLSGASTTTGRAYFGEYIGIGDNSPDFALEIAASTTNGYFAVSGYPGGDGDKFVINGSGNVGIGTTTPPALLTVGSGGGTTAAAGIQFGNDVSLYRSAADTLKTDDLFVAGNGLTVTGNIQFSNNVGSNRQMYIDNGALALQFGNQTADYFSVAGGTNYAERFRIVSSGNVGIGTTTPGVGILTSGSLNGIITHQKGTSESKLIIEGGVPELDLVDNTSGATGWNTLVLDAGALTLQARDNGYVVTQNIISFVNSSGNVGIATTSAVSKLTLYESGESTTQTNFTQALTNAGLNIVTDNNSNVFTPGVFWSTDDDNSAKPKAGIYTKLTSGGSYMYFGTSNAYATGITNDAIVIDPSGNIGIASTTPSTALSVQGNIWGSGDVRLFGTSATTTISGGLIVGTNTLWAPAGGNIGIGTTGPEAKIDIIGAQQGTITTLGSEVPGLILEQQHTASTPNYGPMIDFRINNGTDIWTVGAITGVAPAGSYVGGLSFFTDPGGETNPSGRRTKGASLVERMRIDNVGNVGIATTSPRSLLEVWGDARFGTTTDYSNSLFTIDSGPYATGTSNLAYASLMGPLYQHTYSSDDGLVLYLPFSEGQTTSTAVTTRDISPYAKDGTLTFMATTTPSPWVTSTDSVRGAPCKAGACLSFDGVDDYISTSFAPSLPQTITLWFYVSSLPAAVNDTMNLLVLPQTGSAYQFGVVYIASTANYYLKATGISLGNFTSASTVSAGKWYFGALVLTATSQTIYLNQEATMQSTAIDPPSGTIAIGGSMGSATRNFWNGLIDEVRIYNRALSADEIRTQYLQGKQSSGSILADTFRVIDTNNDVNLYVNNSGNVGIGTANPTAKLEFVAATTAAGGIEFGDDVTFYRSAANVLKTDDYFALGSTAVVATAAGISGESGSVKINAITGQTIYLLINDAQALSFNGVGKMFSAGQVEFYSTAAGKEFRTYNQNYGSLTFGIDMDTGNITKVGSITANSGATIKINGGDSIGFYRVGASGANTEFIRSDEVGDTVPRFLMRVGGAMEWGPGNADRDTNLYRSAANTLKTDDSFTVAGTNLIVTTGTILVSDLANSTTYGYRNKVTGDADYRYGILADGKQVWGDGTNTFDTNLYRSSANVLKTDDGFIAFASSTIVGDFSAGASGVPTLFVDDGGNVGIATTSAVSKLTLYESGESTTQTNFTQALTNAGLNIVTDNNSNVFTPGVFWSTDDDNATKPKAGIYTKLTSGGSYMYFGTSNNYATGITNDAIVIDPSGNVGIASTTPSTALSVQGNIWGSGDVRFFGISATTTISGGLIVGTNTLWAPAGGNVGIGTTGPGHPLNIHSATGNYFPLSLTSAGLGTAGNWIGLKFGFTDSTYQKGAIFYEGQDGDARGKMYFALDPDTGSGNVVVADAKMTIDYNGKVGIGTTTPAELLNIAGGNLLIDSKASTTSFAWTDVMGSPASVNGIKSFAVYNGQIYAGDSAGNIWRYNGSNSWTDVMGTPATIGLVASMAVWNNNLYAGDNVGDVYRYDGGTTWTKVMDIGAIIYTLVVYNGNLYSGDSGGNVWRYDIATWTDVMITPANTSAAQTSAVYNNKLYIGDASGNIYRYNNDNTWTDVMVSPANIADARSLAVYNGQLYAGNWDGAGTSNVYVMTDIDNNWTDILGSPGSVYLAGSLAVYNGQLYLGAYGNPTENVYRYDGGTYWVDVVSGTISNLDALQIFNGNLYAGDAGGNIYEYTANPFQSYALKFRSEGEVASLWFKSASSGQGNEAQYQHGNFIFSHGITTNSGAFDIAESYPTMDPYLSPGEIVSTDSLNPGYLVRSSKPYQSDLVGVISSQPGFLLSDKTDSGAAKVSVALAGRVPVKVTTDNGPIQIGDYLTSASSTPGAAMKATRAGRVIGIALESFDSAQGKILVFINPHWWGGGELASSTVEIVSSSNNASSSDDGFFSKLMAMITNAILEVKKDIVTHSAFKSIITVSKSLIAGRTVTLERNAVLAEDSKLEVQGETDSETSFVTYSIQSARKEIMVSGSASLITSENGGVEAKIVFHPSLSSVLSDKVPIRVLVTPTSITQGGLYVAEKSIYGFTIKELNWQEAGAAFDWIMIGRVSDPELAQETLSEVENVASQETSVSVNAVIPAGAIEAPIYNEAILSTSQITIIDWRGLSSPSIATIGQGFFIIKLAEPAKQEIQFSYQIVNLEAVSTTTEPVISLTTTDSVIINSSSTEPIITESTSTESFINEPVIIPETPTSTATTTQ
ncbi:MAG: hypothetical protein HYW70_01645, partial [Candidatus Nealsonbacteria bacterium]|nr:hypothetical protein [Candidatus Nealsonbacteria bacterium]